VARVTGHTVHTLRHWEAVGLLEPPPRRSGQRRFPPSVVARVAVVDLARRAGLSLAEIRELVTAERDRQPPGGRWRGLAGRKLAELEELATTVEERRRLLRHLRGCSCADLEECAGRAACPE
jgi:MerR family transcriptional regulator, redox-sensitive transcriptional activator SoxR